MVSLLTASREVSDCGAGREAKKSSRGRAESQGDHTRSGGEKGLRGSGAGTLGVPLEGTRRVGGLLGVAGQVLCQCSCLENPRDGGAWWATVYEVAQSWTLDRKSVV